MKIALLSAHRICSQHRENKQRFYDFENRKKSKMAPVVPFFKRQPSNTRFFPTAPAACPLSATTVIKNSLIIRLMCRLIFLTDAMIHLKRARGRGFIHKIKYVFFIISNCQLLNPDYTPLIFK